jgi:hypothetical protein
MTAITLHRSDPAKNLHRYNGLFRLESYVDGPGGDKPCSVTYFTEAPHSVPP